MKTLLNLTAAELRVGDEFSSGGVITVVTPYTLPGYNVDYVRTCDTKHPAGCHWPAAIVLTVLRDNPPSN